MSVGCLNKQLFALSLYHRINVIICQYRVYSVSRQKIWILLFMSYTQQQVTLTFNDSGAKFLQSGAERDK